MLVNEVINFCIHSCIHYLHQKLTDKKGIYAEHIIQTAAVQRFVGPYVDPYGMNIFN